MGYFPNGSAGDAYEEKYCQRCARFIDNDCPVLALHGRHNYAECNNEDSMLHELIPLDNSFNNVQCTFFIERNPQADAPVGYHENIEKTGDRE